MPVILLLVALGLPPQEIQAPPGARLQVFLDCDGCFADYLREEVSFVDFVRDREHADVHVLVTSTGTAAGGREYTVAFIGGRTLQGRDRTLTVTTGPGEPEDVQRRQLLTTLRIGLLAYVADDRVPRDLEVNVSLLDAETREAGRRDPWDNWVFSLEASASLEAEESNSERQVFAAMSADRITPDWKMTFGLAFDQEREEFDLDDDEPVEVDRHEREFDWLIVKALGEHWSLGARGEIESSTFDNTRLRVFAAPAIEYNLFPYSAYTRRQLRAQYSIGGRYQEYYEETLFGRFDETLPEHYISLTYDQREQWGSVEGSLEWSQFLEDLSKNRLEASADLSWRIVRGLSVSADASASRIRDQISLRRRGATPEEILLQLRELQSGYEYEFSFGLRYTFGSIFSSIVNPRFGQ